MGHDLIFHRDNNKLTLHLIETSFNAFANRADPDQAALVRAVWSGSTLVAYGNMINLIIQEWIWQYFSNYSVLYTNMKSYMIIHSGRSLAWILMRRMVKGHNWKKNLHKWEMQYTCKPDSSWWCRIYGVQSHNPNLDLKRTIQTMFKEKHSWTHRISEWSVKYRSSSSGSKCVLEWFAMEHTSLYLCCYCVFCTKQTLI